MPPSLIGIFSVVVHFRKKVGIKIGITNGIGDSTFEMNKYGEHTSVIYLFILMRIEYP